MVLECFSYRVLQRQRILKESLLNSNQTDLLSKGLNQMSEQNNSSPESSPVGISTKTALEFSADAENKIPTGKSNQGLASIIVAYRSFGIFKDEARNAMIELARRKNAGETFNIDGYIKEKLA